jgi:ethanolamine ammonia-lyase small subunit
LFEVQTEASSKSEYLLRPDLGRTLGEVARSSVRVQCPQDPDVQIVVGDGLSVSAVAAQVPGLLPLLCDGGRERNWTVGRPFVVRHCRVGIYEPHRGPADAERGSAAHWRTPRVGDR